jgi:hypothetical protein
MMGSAQDTNVQFVSVQISSGTRIITYGVPKHL